MSLTKEYENSTIEQVDMDKRYGCGCCAAICKHEAIIMKIDPHGFLRPYLNNDKCNQCGLCAKICPSMSSPQLFNVLSDELFALWSKNTNIRLSTSSGGAALSFGLTLNKLGFFILGAVFGRDFRRVHHIVAKSPQEILRTTGSKYIQSDISNALREALENKRKDYIVFGTPCQIAGIRNIVERMNLADKYYLVDFFCHGVPSYLLWSAFLKEINKKTGRIQHLELRNKAKGWHKYNLFCIGTNGRYIKKTFTNTQFARFYLPSYCLNDTCYTCKYGQYSASDLRIGDFWGSDFQSDFLGTSIGIPFTEKGYQLIENTEDLEFRSMPVTSLIKSQDIKRVTISKPLKNDKVMESLQKGTPLINVYKKFLARKYMVNAIKQAPVRVASRILPESIKKIIRDTGIC
jgi:coenzyme F420-reducing hydrogenase beta subunit